MRNLCLVACLILPVGNSLAAIAGEGSNTTTGQVRLPSGLLASYDYHFDRNALADSSFSADGLVALTESGVLMRFEPKTLDLDRIWFGPERATCLGHGPEGAILAGFEDGRVGKVDPANLALTELARLPAMPVWLGFRPAIGQRPGGIVAVVMRKKQLERDGKLWDALMSEVHDLATGKIYPTGHHWTALLLDSKQRLWMGANYGEWGGQCMTLDLPSGKLETIEPVRDPSFGEKAFWNGVRGFLELPDGAIWDYGGTVHGGFCGTYIHRLDGPKVEFLFRADNTEEAQKPQAEGEDRKPAKPGPPARPQYPITHLVLDRASGEITIFSASDIFRTDSTLKTWTLLPELTLEHPKDNAFIYGKYPRINAIHRNEGPKPSWIFATEKDGYAVMAGGKQTNHTQPGQLGASQIERIESSGAETFFFDWNDRSPPWKFEDGKWSTTTVAPPVKLLREDPGFEGQNTAWSETSLIFGPGGTFYTISKMDWKGTLTTVRWREGNGEILGRELSELNPPGTFVTPDQTLWNAWYDDLLLFDRGRWTKVGSLPEAADDDPRAKVVEKNEAGDRRSRLEVGYHLKAFGEAKPPWILLDRAEKQLLRLNHGPNFQDPTITRVSLKDVDQPLAIEDALPDQPGELLLATDRGLKIYEMATGKLRPCSFPSPDRPVKRLARDGRNRLWLGGEGLWMLDEKNRLQDLAEVPMIGRSEVSALAADPSQKEGVIVSLGVRGVAFLRVEAGAGF